MIRACEAAAGAVEQFGQVRKAARKLFNGNGRHGAGVDPALIIVVQCKELWRVVG